MKVTEQQQQEKKEPEQMVERWGGKQEAEAAEVAVAVVSDEESINEKVDDVKVDTHVDNMEVKEEVVEGGDDIVEEDVSPNNDSDDDDVINDGTMEDGEKPQKNQRESKVCEPKVVNSRAAMLGEAPTPKRQHYLVFFYRYTQQQQPS